ncbi:sensor histidine kinase [Modestobacter italicus]|uniref:sensor histidine kinase n=1 Tax=Modestobacter italicus (strain DSM 44449 / CECT 9708 / BC 501) TaxID=2732864 RepID=UPI001C9594E6|nr:HAMP domain-containing sensor histidine kinase [Modestobacter italicus]
MTLAADTRPATLPGLLTDLVRVVRSHLPHPAAEPVSTGDALVRALCHDMRSPLAALESVLDRLDADDDRRPELLELARAQAQHLASMLRTANATGGAPERRGARSLADVLQASVAASGLPATQLTVRVGEDAADVVVGDARVQRILTNLLENAHRHGQGRPVRLRVDRRAEWVEFALTQPGVPADRVLGHLNRLTPPVDLSGLGLWSVQRQTRELGGRLAWCLGEDGDFTLVVRLPDR